MPPLEESSSGSAKTSSSVSESSGSEGSSSSAGEPPCCVLLAYFDHSDLDVPVYTEYADFVDGYYNFPINGFYLTYDAVDGWIVYGGENIAWPALGAPLIYYEDPLGRYYDIDNNQIEISLTECVV